MEVNNFDNSLQTGTVLKGTSYSYRIERTLGQGSFGITYLASVKMTGSLGAIDANIKVAIKEFFMRDINGRSDTTVTSGSNGGLYDEYKHKFTREALNLSKLQHPNIIKVIESFEANNTVYYVMEYIDGGSLDDYIVKNNGLEEEEAIRIVKQIGSAISFMHSRGMLHLDLKPSNIMRKLSGDVILIDFGLSKQYNNDGEPESSTKVGAGTSGYAPIEQANYREGNDFPVTMDVYALGGTMFKMLTGIRPPEASDILNEGFPEFELQGHGILDDVIAIISKAMSPLRRDRYQSIDLFTDALGGIILSDSKRANFSKQNNTNRRNEKITDKSIGEIRIKYDQGYIGRYMYELTITPHELSLFVPFVSVESKAKSKLPSDLWEIIIERLSKDIIKKEENPYNSYEDSETPPSFEVIFLNSQKEQIEKLYVTGWGADSGNIKNWTPYELDRKMHRLIPSLCWMEDEIKKTNDYEDVLSAPDTLHITEYNEKKKYGYIADISLRKKCMDIKAYPLKSHNFLGWQKGMYRQCTIPIDIEDFRRRLYQHRFLDYCHWEEDYDDMIFEGETISITCDYISNYNGCRTIYYSRTEYSMGGQPLEMAVHNLLAKEFEFHRFLSMACASEEVSISFDEDTNVDII